MEASDPLAEDVGGGGDDPFGDVPADGGGANLVEPGNLEGDNPSEAAEQEPLPEADPLADPPAAAAAEEPEPAPEPPAEEPTPPAEEPEPPAPTPEQEAEAEAKVAAQPDPPAEDPPADPPAESGTRRRASSGSGKRSAERPYVVIECDKKDKPLRVAGEVKARTAKDARRMVFNGMEATETRLAAIPARYWEVKNLKAKVREEKDIEES